MKRLIFQQIMDWKQSVRRKPLILQGARQVGKTYILTEFAREAYENSVQLNFDDNPELKDFFEQDLDPKRIIETLSIHFNTKIHPGGTLIVFDEVQECPNALNSLKYFHEKANEYHLCAAGSLLGVKLAHTKGFPVGQVNFLHMYPMSFMEFLDATDNARLKTFLQSIDKIEPIPTPFHNRLIELLKKYFFIGGMPETVYEYVKHNELIALRDVQKEILKTYQLDFSKHTTSADAMKITQVWDSIPSQLAKDNKKFLYSAVRKSARAREYETSLQWLHEAGMITRIFNIKTPKLPLKAYTDLEAFKLYMIDVGLLNAHSNLKPALLVEGNALFQEFKGSLTENFVAQTLMSIFEENYYWTSQGRAEVDFLLDIDNDIYPIEVKSGISQKKRSLRTYSEMYKPKMLVRTSLNNLKRDGDVLNIPLYLIGDITKLLRIAGITS